MAGPWEKYSKPSAESAPAGPWAKYAAPAQEQALEVPQESLGRQLARSTIDTLPVVGGVVGGIVGGAAGLLGGPAAPASVPAGGVVGAGLGYAGGAELADVAKHYFLGDEAKANVIDQPAQVAGRVAGNLRDGAMAEMGGQALSGVALGARKAIQSAGGKTKDLAERFAVNATGATGKQTERFAEDAGRQLLDRKLIKFGDAPEQIAERVGAAAAKAGDDISGALKGLDAKGATASVDDIVGVLNGRINKLSKDPSKADVVRKLESIVDDIRGGGKIIDRGGYTVAGQAGRSGKVIDRGEYVVPGQAGRSNKVVSSEDVSLPAETKFVDVMRKDPLTGQMVQVKEPVTIAASKVPVKSNTQITMSPKTGMPEVLPDIPATGPTSVRIQENTALRTNPKTGMQEAVPDIAATNPTFVPIKQNTRLRTNPLTGMQEEVGQSIPLSRAEEVKRGFGQKIKNWMDPQAGAANKEAYLAYMDEVEKKAIAADPTLAAQFAEAKKTYGLLAPIEEAAAKRAAQLGQHPVGGLLDVAAAGAGTIASGGVGGIATGVASAAGRRVIAPRASSAAAATLDKIGKRFAKTPTAENVFKKSPAIMSSIVKALSPEASVIQKAADKTGSPDGEKSIADFKGDKKWAVDGFAKVLEHSPEGLDNEAVVEKLFSSRKGKALLVQASDLKPGSKAMNDVYSKIKKELSQGDK